MRLLGVASFFAFTVFSYGWVLHLNIVVVQAQSPDSNTAIHIDNDEHHPDPNDEEYEDMVYIGRLQHHGSEDDDNDDDVTKVLKTTRMGFDTDNGVRYIFGTSFDASHKNIAPQELEHLPHHPDLADRIHQTKTRAQVLAEQQQQKEKPVKPKPFGFVHTHPLDGGVTPPMVVRVDPFFIDIAPVTNKQFAKFTKATFYETEAEKFGWSFVLASFVPNNNNNNLDLFEVDPDAPHWVAVPGAYWRQPEGPESSYKYREHHPVVHVSHRDAAEYCAWVGKRLPGEREWEAAARWNAGHVHNRTLYAWGDPTIILVQPDDDSNKSNNNRNTTTIKDDHVQEHHPPPRMDLHAEWKKAAQYANLWGPAGPFPWNNDAHDGWRGTSPIKSFLPNAAGIYDLTGNVWEWMRGGKHKARIVRGASYVDSLDGSVNHAATLGARDTVHGTTTTGNIGFRCVKSPRRKVEHHYKWHDEDEHGPLAIEDEYGERKIIPRGSTGPRGSTADAENEEENDDEFNDNDIQPNRRRKKKVIKKRERLSTEL